MLCAYRMQTKDDPQSALDANHESTRGVRRLPDRPGRPNAYGVQWAEREWDETLRREVRRVKSQFFAKEKQRDARFAELVKARREGALRTLSRIEADEWRAFRAVIGETPWQQVVAAWQKEQKTHNRGAGSKTLSAQVKDYLVEIKLRADRGELALNTYRQRKHKLTLLAADLGNRPLGDVHAEDLTAWLKHQKLTVAGTWNNYLKITRGFFAAAVDAGLIAENPCARLAARDERPDEVGILTVPQLAQLFHTARTYRDGRGEPVFALALRRLALEAFAGVRFSSANRLRPEDINTADRGIRHPAASIKTRRRHYVEGFPEPLWAWLAIAPADAALTERQYLKLKSDLFGVARVPHPHNCLRHSFATYHLAARANPGETAVLLCHRDQKKLWDHYKGNATSAEGKRWELLTPPNAAAWAREWTDQVAAPAVALPPAASRPTETAP